MHKIFTTFMKSRKVVLIFFVVLAFAVGFSTLQDYAFDETESIATNEFSSQPNTITVEIDDGIGSGDNGS